MDFISRLRGLRAENDLSQEEVASRIGISISGYRKIEGGISSPTLNNLILLAEFYKVSLDYLTGRKESRD